ncbi:hypothetical protein CTEN210_09883 [Chaetoceros tenuissimus]|uniref:Uncharacterized protein n=1 Tax=Chaetoceros tenuissimus TaxID=426638 RepID=A0AAD3CWN5_9STRA|nr:hypothetical protein CTEN210_09883 [Chaetoceros tenuissimus]
MQSAKRIKIAHESSSSSSKRSSSSHDINHINELPQELFQHCLEFVGKGNFAFVAPVSKHFYWNYISVGVPMENNILTVDALLQIGRNKYTSAEAIATGSMRLATECFLEAPYEFQEAICRYAAIHGRDDILECGISFGLPMPDVFDEKWETLATIVKNGHMGTLKKLWKEGVVFDSKWFALAMEEKDCIRELHLLIRNGYTNIDDDEYSITLALGRKGHLDLLKEDHDKGEIHLGPGEFWYMPSGGHVEVMKWFIQHYEWEWCSWVFCGAASSESIPMLELCLRNGCPFDEEVYVPALKCNDKAMALNLVKWLRQHNIPWDERACANAARQGNLDALIWLRKNGCPWDEDTFHNTVVSGEIDVMEYSFANDCPSDPSRLFLFAFSEGKSEAKSLEIFKWLRQKSIDWNEEASYEASKFRHVSTLKWALENGCPWNELILETAIEIYNLPVLEYCVKFQLHRFQNIYVRAIEFMHYNKKSTREKIRMLQLIHDNGIPWNKKVSSCAEELDEKGILRWLRCNGCQ